MDRFAIIGKYDREEPVRIAVFDDKKTAKKELKEYRRAYTKKRHWRLRLKKERTER